MIKVTLNEFDKGTKDQYAFALSTVARMEAMVNNPVFLELLQSVSYTDNVYFPSDRYQIEATNEDLVRAITGGNEWLADPVNQFPDHEIDLKVRLEPRKDNALGGVDHPDPTIKTNIVYFQKWFEQNNWIALSGHWFHEWLHVAGFQHKFNPENVADFNDAVYTVGNLFVNVELERQQGKVLSLSKDYFIAYDIPLNFRAVD